MASLCEQQSEEEGLAVLSVCGNDLAAGRKGDPIEAWGRAKRQSHARSGYCALLNRYADFLRDYGGLQRDMVLITDQQLQRMFARR